jgi:hypothetical protein
MKQWSFASTQLVFLFACASMIFPSEVRGGSFAKTPFKADDADAVVLLEELEGSEHFGVISGGIWDFQEIDLATLQTGKRYFSMDRNIVIGRIKTKNPKLRLRIVGALSSISISPYSGARRPAGVFALVRTRGSSLTGREMNGCFPEGAPVFRFEAGHVNLVSSSSLRAGFMRTSVRLDSDDESVKSARLLLEEYPIISAPVKAAPLIGSIKFVKKNGEASGCFNSKQIAVVN